MVGSVRCSRQESPAGSFLTGGAELPLWGVSVSVSLGGEALRDGTLLRFGKPSEFTLGLTEVSMDAFLAGSRGACLVCWAGQ